MKTYVQLYSGLNHQPWDKLLDQVQANGFDGVEGFFGVFDDPPAFREMMDNRSLSMPQAHVPLKLMEEDFDKAVSICNTLGIKTMIGPFLMPDDRPTDSAGWKALGDRLNVLDGKLKDAGFEFAWHNHDFEFVATPEGEIPMDILLDAAPNMDWEADLGWLFRHGADPLAWLNVRADRVISVHLKDVQPDFANAPESGWADLGHGVNDWKPIFEKLKKLERLRACVAEHDDPSDFGRFVRRWMESYRSLMS